MFSIAEMFKCLKRRSHSPAWLKSSWARKVFKYTLAIGRSEQTQNEIESTRQSNWTYEGKLNAYGSFRNAHYLQRAVSNYNTATAVVAGVACTTGVC